MKYQIEKMENFTKYNSDFVCVDIRKKLMGQHYRDNKIMAVFSNNIQACALLLDRKETAHILKRCFKNNYERLKAKGWR